MGVNPTDYTHSVDGDTIAVFEWHDEKIPELEKFVDKLNGSTAINPNTRKQIEIGDDWFRYDMYTCEWHSGQNTRHAISYANVPEGVQSAASAIVQNRLNQCGAVVKQVDFESDRFILADQSLIESRFPDGNRLINK